MVERLQNTQNSEIPNDWNIQQLDSLGVFTKGKNIPKSAITETGVPCVLYGEIYTKYDFNSSTIFSKTTAEIAMSSVQFQKGDVLFAGSGETAEDIGKCFAYTGEGKAYAGGDIIVFTPKASDSVYLSYILNSPEVNRQKSYMGQGSSVFHIYPSNLKKIRIFLPSRIEEQKEIATALFDTDALIKKLEHIITKKRNFKIGTMQELLNPKKEWESEQIGNLLTFQVGYPFSSIYFNQKQQGIRLVKNRDLKSDDLIFHYNSVYDDSFLVKNGDVLISMDGEFISCLWNKGRALLNQRVGRLVGKTKVSLLFMFYYLQKPLKEIENRTSSTTVKHLSHSDIENLILPIPKNEEQLRIAQILSDMDQEILKLEEQLKKYRMIKQGMMQTLLTGKIRLI